MGKLRHPLLLLLGLLLFVEATALVTRSSALEIEEDENFDPSSDDDAIAENEEGEDGEEDDEESFGGEEEETSDEDALYDDEEEEEDEEASSETPENDGDVISLTTTTFQKTIDSTHAIMVEWYAPWCGHCQTLAPEYREAAAVLKADNVTLAKIDGSTATTISEQFGVEGFPTIYFFLKGVSKQYAGGRTSADIVEWVRKRIGPPALSLTEQSEAEKVIAARKVIGVGYFSKFEGAEYEEFQSVASAEDDVFFVQTTDAGIAKLFSLESGPPAIAAVKDQEEKFTLFEGKFVQEEISTFFRINKLPLVITFSPETSTQIFGKGVKKQLLLFADAVAYHDLFPIYLKAAQIYRGLVFVHINSSDMTSSTSILDFFGVKADVPSIMGYESENDGKKFNLDLPLTEENIQEFAKDFVDDKLKPFMKSDPIPEKNDGDVKIVVGKTVDEIVFDDSKDVLLEVYAPWCSHCKSFAPTYEKLGKRFSSVDSVVIAKMDGTTNEHSKVQAEGYPTVLFFPAGNKAEPINIEKHRTLKTLTKFLKKNCQIPFTLPKKGEHTKDPLPEELAEEKELQEGEKTAVDDSPSKDEL